MSEVEEKVTIEKKQSKKEKWSKKKKRIATFIVLGLVGIGTIIFLWFQRIHGEVYLYFSDEKLKIGEEVTIDVRVSDLPEVYPAASFAIDFDKDQLEFLELKQGNIKIVKEDGDSFIPTWNYETQIANVNGKIKTIYLDMTAGDAPFSKKGFKRGNKDVLFRITFLIKYSCSKGDIVKLTMSEATFATAEGEGSTTLALQKNNLRATAEAF